jgi:hypothetical protein
MMKKRRKTNLKMLLEKQQNFKINSSKHLGKLKRIFKDPFEIKHFCDKTISTWKEGCSEVKEIIGLQTAYLAPIAEEFADKGYDFLHDSKESKVSAFKIFNLLRVMVTMGCHFHINGT